MRTFADRLRSHARANEHVYRVLLEAMAADWERGGVVEELFAGWEDAPAGAFVHLRALAGLHRIVLSGRAPELVRFYTNLGGTAAPEGVWPQARTVIAAHLKELQDGLHIAPQTNEPGRSAALLVGLFVAVRQTGLTSVRLLEPGASAGLNLHVDRFRIGGRPAGGSNGTGGEGAPWWSGPDGSPVQLPDAVRGSIQPIDYRIVERAGCDPWPVDIGRSEGRLRLRSFVWPFQVERHERLRSALAVAAVNPVVIEQAGAASWLTRKLAVAPAPGLLTVVWHSITRHYWPAQEARAAAAAVAAAGGRMPLAHISMEYPRVEDGQPAELWVTIHTPGRQSRSCKLGTVGRQGGQVRLVAAASWD